MAYIEGVGIVADGCYVFVTSGITSAYLWQIQGTEYLEMGLTANAKHSWGDIDEWVGNVFSGNNSTFTTPIPVGSSYIFEKIVKAYGGYPSVSAFWAACIDGTVLFGVSQSPSIPMVVNNLPPENLIIAGNLSMPKAVINEKMVKKSFGEMEDDTAFELLVGLLDAKGWTFATIPEGVLRRYNRNVVSNSRHGVAYTELDPLKQAHLNKSLRVDEHGNRV